MIDLYTLLYAWLHHPIAPAPGCYHIAPLVLSIQHWGTP